MCKSYLKSSLFLALLVCLIVTLLVTIFADENSLIGRNLGSHLALGLAFGIFGFFFLLFSYHQGQKRFSIFREELKLEGILFEGPANHIWGFKSRGGWLFLTQKQLFFAPHRLNFQKKALRAPLKTYFCHQFALFPSIFVRDKSLVSQRIARIVSFSIEKKIAALLTKIRFLEIPLRVALEDIETASKEKSLGIISNGILVERKSGGREFYVCLERNIWLKKLEEAIKTLQKQSSP